MAEMTWSTSFLEYLSAPRLPTLHYQQQAFSNRHFLDHGNMAEPTTRKSFEDCPLVMKMDKSFRDGNCEILGRNTTPSVIENILNAFQQLLLVLADTRGAPDEGRGALKELHAGSLCGEGSKLRDWKSYESTQAAS
jgi:hypothetical protein